MQNVKDIFEFVTTEESAYKLPIEPVEGWSWSMRDHIRLTILYKNSQFEKENENRTKRPVKNIVRPILNVQYRTEGFDVKDIEIYVNNSDNYYKSFLVKKYHEKWALENQMDTFIDEVVESFVDFGGVLVKQAKEVRPEVVPLQSIAFADQTDILSGAFAIKHYFTPQQLREMKGIWDDNAIDMAILQADRKKTQDKQNVPSKTPTKYCEAYEVHGQFPASWVDENADPDLFTPQIHIIAFYQDRDNKKQGISFFAKKEPKLPFKFLARDKVYGRALGFGGVEELFEAQVWTNFSQIHKANLLEAASKMLHLTTDPTFKNKNTGADYDNNDILLLQEGRDFRQIDTTPRNIAIFDNSVNEWEAHARQMGAGGEVLMGESPSAGTPFKLQELIVSEAKGLHYYRQGKLAVFIDEIYRDWIIPYIQKEVSKGQYFLTELSMDELQEISERVATSRLNRIIKEKILSGETVTPVQVEEMRSVLRDTFLKQGAKQFIEILKGEMNETPLDVFTNIAGKQKDLAHMTDKLVNVFRQVIATPQILGDDRMVKWLNQILESSGISPIGFGGARNAIAAPASTTEPIKALAGQRTGAVA